ncbi:hypothetical protein R3P38DRAFT_2759629 [Favolaschia claudopus]|uniref:Uncharacterized protein n=1 Tax=Favolaschia claudopus TaxID=2862362 RepID=A0AAW0E0I4_9AGAR
MLLSCSYLATFGQTSVEFFAPNQDSRYIKLIAPPEVLLSTIEESKSEFSIRKVTGTSHALLYVVRGFQSEENCGRSLVKVAKPLRVGAKLNHIFSVNHSAWPLAYLRSSQQLSPSLVFATSTTMGIAAPTSAPLTSALRISLKTHSSDPKFHSSCSKLNPKSKLKTLEGRTGKWINSSSYSDVINQLGGCGVGGGPFVSEDFEHFSLTTIDEEYTLEVSRVRDAFRHILPNCGASIFGSSLRKVIVCIAGIVGQLRLALARRHKSREAFPSLEIGGHGGGLGEGDSGELEGFHVKQIIVMNNRIKCDLVPATMAEFGGSTAKNPWILDVHGELVLQVDAKRDGTQAAASAPANKTSSPVLTALRNMDAQQSAGEAASGKRAARKTVRMVPPSGPPRREGVRLSKDYPPIPPNAPAYLQAVARRFAPYTAIARPTRLQTDLDLYSSARTRPVHRSEEEKARRRGDGGVKMLRSE